jgi:hypothetical protein
MAAAGLTSWAEVGLIISLATFVGIVAWVFLRKKSSWEHLRRLPLDDETDIDANRRPGS